MKKVLITGTSSGLGLALADQYLELGWLVYGLSRRSPVIPHRNYRHVCTDIGSSSVKSDLSILLNGEDKLDLVILNAGVIGTISTMKKAKVSDLKKSMNINLWGNRSLLDYLFRNLDEVGQVVAISSGAAVNASVGWSGYALSKAALNMLIQLYAVEETATHFTAFAPGLIDTPMQDYLATITDLETFNGIERIQTARHTPAMPKALELSVRLPKVFDTLYQNYSSGSFVDLRQMN